MIPQSYEQWRRCITIGCGIALTPEFIAQRLKALHDPSDAHTRKFIERYGRGHHERVCAWFERAASEAA